MCVCAHTCVFSAKQRACCSSGPACTWWGGQQHIPGRSLLTIASVTFSHPWFKLFSQLKWITSDLVQITGICKTSSSKHLAKCLCTAIRQPTNSPGSGPEAPLTVSISDSGHLEANLEAKGEHYLRSESLPGLRPGCVFNLSIELQSWWVIIL